jgi:hypothetical protein
MALLQRVKKIEERQNAGIFEEPLVLRINFVEPTPNGPGASWFGRCVIIEGNQSQTFVRKEGETEDVFEARICDDSGVGISKVS